MEKKSNDFKIGYVKAYYRVKWIFLEKFMLKLGCRCSWINLIMKYITSISHVVNDES